MGYQLHRLITDRVEEAFELFRVMIDEIGFNNDDPLLLCLKTNYYGLEMIEKVRCGIFFTLQLCP